MDLGGEVYDVFMYFFFLHYVVQIHDWCWCRILFITCCHDSLLDLMQNLSMWCNFCHNSLCYALISLVVCCWDTLVVIMHVFCFDIPFVPCWRDAHHACFCVILIGVFSLRVLVVEHLLEPLLCEGILPCMIETPSLCTSPYWQHIMQWPTPSWHWGP